ncbi:MAG TPA: DUF1629 domain-containing protein [Planctomycetaceae bacterium]|nr:DUF1629 domain-containing protein [Planctomycetaceae bacterium]
MIYKLRESVEKERPRIDFTLPADGTSAYDWESVNHIITSRLPPSEYRPMETLTFEVNRVDAEEWDFYPIPGTFGLVSNRVRSCWEEYCFGDIAFLPAVLNTTNYWIPYALRMLDCLDHANSRLTCFKNSTKVMSIEKYAFHTERISECRLFRIPEQRSNLFATGPVCDEMIQADFRGFDFLQVFPQQ